MDMLNKTKRIKAKINHKYAFSLTLIVLFLLPFEAALATGSIANRIIASCAGFPISPDVSSCSACHTGARTLTDLNASGILARSSANDIQFCPSKNTPVPTPTPTPTPSPTPAPGTGGMSGTGPVTGSMGIGMGGRLGSDDDDDDDDDESDDDDRSSSASSRFSRFLKSLGITSSATRRSRSSD